MSTQNIKSTGCCDPFNPEKWDGKEIIWKKKLFVKDSVVSFLHIPLNMDGVMTRNMNLIEKADAKIPNLLMLTDEKSLWGADIYIEVNKQVPNTHSTTLSGTFLTKVFEGPYQDVGKWIPQMQEYVLNKKEKIVKLFFYYTTCPKCAKTYGKNYVVLFAQIK